MADGNFLKKATLNLMTNPTPKPLRDSKKDRWKKAQKHEAEFWQGPNAMPFQIERVATRYHPLLRKFEIKARDKVQILEVGSGPTCATQILPTKNKIFLDPLMRVYQPLCPPETAGRQVCAMGEGLPFADRKFDFVFSFNVLDHVQSPERFVAELVRVTRPGGKVVVGVYTHPRIFAVVRNLIERILPLFGEVAHPYFISRQALVQLLENQGLKTEKTVQVYAPSRQPSLHRQDWGVISARQ